MVFSRIAIGAALAAVHAAPGVAQAGELTRAPAFRAAKLTELPRAGWVTNGGNLANQRYSPLTQINRGNVENLRAVWRASLGGSGMGPRARGCTTTASSSRDSPAAISARAGASRRSTRRTGKLKWTFYTVPGPGEAGHETWPKDSDVWK